MAARILRARERIVKRRPERFAGVRQRGAVALMFGLMLMMVIAFIGMALDLSQAYDRRTELQMIADTAALAGARSLDGTAAGVSAAVQQATTRVGSMRYNYSRPASLAGATNAGAITFAATPDAPPASWKNAAAASAAPAGLLFMQFDAGVLSAADATPYGQVNTHFMHAVSPGLDHITTTARAVAGRFSTASTTVLLYR